MSHPKNELHELLPYLRPHEIAEIERLSMPPKDANGCVVFLSDDGDHEAEKHEAVQAYIRENGYMPPEPVLAIVFDTAPAGGWSGVSHSPG